MRHDGGETVALNGEGLPTAQRDLPSARSSPVSLGPASAHDVLNSSAIEELLHQALVQDDQGAWAELQQCLGETVRGWLRRHPSKEAACRWESEEHYVAQAFERFWQATVSTQRLEFSRLSAALQYLSACLHGAILDSLRASARQEKFR